MSGLLDNINMPPCIWFQWENKRNAIASMIAGIMYSIGWWFFIDAASVYPKEMQAGYHVCGIIGTLSLFMVNAVSNAQVRGDFEGACMGARGARLWLFLGFVMGFASVIASCWILFADFVAPEKDHQWPGVALFLQNSFVFIGSLVYKFGRSEDVY